MARHRWTRWVIEGSAGDVPLPWGRGRPPRGMGLRA